jgi:hypothetical protein
MMNWKNNATIATPITIIKIKFKVTTRGKIETAK